MGDLVRNGEGYASVLERLNQASVDKHWDAYGGIDWDAPEHRVDRDDPRWQLPNYEPLGASEWYQRQPPDVRARMGLDLIAGRFKAGADLENMLSRGLLAFAAECPIGSTAYRYAYHELIEEAQHTLMFREFVRRSSSDARGVAALQRWMGRVLPRLGRQFPELLFVFALAGEVPIDSTQRRELLDRSVPHPLMHLVMRIHVTEEARHVCFAQHYLREYFPRASWVARARIRLLAPFVTDEISQMILRTPSWLLERYGAPASVRRAVQRGPVARQHVSRALQPLLDFYAELGVITRATAPLWHARGYAAARPRLGSSTPTA